MKKRPPAPVSATRLLKMTAKCSDLFSASLVQVGVATKHYEGYVPEFFPTQHFGDYVSFDINVDTGQIVNWRKPKAKDLVDFK